MHVTRSMSRFLAQKYHQERTTRRPTSSELSFSCLDAAARSRSYMAPYSLELPKCDWMLLKFAPNLYNSWCDISDWQKSLPPTAPCRSIYIYIYKQLNNDEVWAQPSCSHLESTPRIAKWAIIAHIRTHPPVVGAPILLEEGCIGGLCLDDPEHFQVAKKHSRTRVVQESHQVMHGYAVLPTVGACQGQSRCKTTATIHLTVSMLPLHPGCIQK